MTVSVGDHVPECTLYEYFNEESDGCSVGPNAFKMSELVKGKRIALFALPGAYTPTCSAKHLPGYVEKAEALKEKVDEIWCVSVNDAFVMGAWGRDNNATGSVRMMADGSAEFTKAVGMDLDLTERGLGVRSRRYSMLLDDGIIKTINLEDAPGGMEVSDADTMLDQV
ncbi:peroxiredoxin [Burkholderiales bacterium]|jgi:glutaredoxin/glutathione-dependent peroxiredoxin|nr:peroxiredoxin [Betaproteobacteria bacterium]MBT6529383.1 peroxiredoxin [Betaproteobacteria bacterium]MBT7427379.1 peroxiredoxin [Betaproteobacteria bacterium]MDC1433267.1 peroxiredoxin [Burkholderiales bacterium]MDC3408407.1 peroxiredoxin [Burkholderiales bacterium]